MPVERHEQEYDARFECAQLRAEVAMLRAQLTDILAILASQERAAAQAVEAAWTEGYEQRAAEESQVPPPRAPGERHLRIVGCGAPAAAAGRALLRHKVALSAVAAGALITAATVPHWHTAEFRVGVPGGGRGPSVVAQAAVAPQQGRPSSPPGQGKSPSPHPSPGSSHGHGHGSPSPGPQGTPPGHATPSPSPDATTADPGTPSATPAPDSPGPSHTPAACTPGP